MWLEWVNEKIREGEGFLERVHYQLKEYLEGRAQHDEEMRQRIESEVEMSLASIKVSLNRFETELKAPNLDLIERYVLEKAISEAHIVTKLLTEVQKTVAKKP